MPLRSSSPKKRWATSPVSNDNVPEEDRPINSIGCQLVRSFEKRHQSGRALVPWFFACSVLRPGFCKFIQACLRLIPLGAMICGPPCGSYVWVNRSTSRRSKKRPLGDCSKLYVRQSNTSFVSIWYQTHLYSRKHYLKGLDIWTMIGKMFRSSLGFAHDWRCWPSWPHAVQYTLLSSNLLVHWCPGCFTGFGWPKRFALWSGINADCPSPSLLYQ